MAAHLHLDPLGGIAGDMFAAAMLDLDPSLGEGLRELLHSAGLAVDVDVRVVEHRDDVFRGRRFVVEDPRERGPDGRKRLLPGAFVMRAGLHAGHAHVAHRSIVARIEGSALSPAAKGRALDMFQRIAVAEAGVHGMDVADVEFHEVGAQDSIADIVTAAVLLARLDEKHGGLTCSTSSLPTGSGRVKTAHGELPVPAPATLALLQGHVVHDDGRPGERVTPTGAAIVSHLVPPASRRVAGVVAGHGIGFGTRTFQGLSNILRVTLTTAQVSSTSTTTSSASAGAWTRARIAELACEIDDMTGEELAIAADALRAALGVVDVVCVPVLMKKGRSATSVRVLCGEAHVEDVARVLFASTTTLGVRVGVVERLELAREIVVVEGARVKRAARPEGATQKADVDDVHGAPSLRELRARRAELERAAGAAVDAAGDDGGAR